MREKYLLVAAKKRMRLLLCLMLHIMEGKTGI